MIKKCFIVQCRGWAEKHLLVGLKLLSCDYKKVSVNSQKNSHLFIYFTVELGKTNLYSQKWKNMTFRLI